MRSPNITLWLHALAAFLVGVAVPLAPFAIGLPG